MKRLSGRKAFAEMERGERHVYLGHMPRFLVSSAVVAITVVALAAATVAPLASAQEISNGCRFWNGQAPGGLNAGGFISGVEFFAGDRISASAGEPTEFGPPTTIRLQVNDALVDSVAFPGTVEFVFPTTGIYKVEWFSDGGNATWTFSCVPTAADPAQEIADLQALVSGLGLPNGLTTALTSKLAEALTALDAADTADACGSLQAFLSQVRAQEGKKLSAEQAQQLTDEATGIRTLLEC